MVHKHREILNNRNAIFSLVKRAAKLSLNRMWRHFSLDDAYTKISGVFCPAPEAFTAVKINEAVGKRIWKVSKIRYVIFND